MTPERYARIRAVLDKRQPDLTVITDDVHKPHNFSAILRTCDAVGIPNIHAVWPGELYRIYRGTAGGSHRWVGVKTHPTLEECIESQKAQGFQVLAAHLSDEAVDYRTIDFTQPTALLMGSELEGVSPIGAALADKHIVVPMLGMVESYNVSVACAIILSEAQRQREARGLYEQPKLDPVTYHRLLFEWAHPKLARYCKRYQLPYPELKEEDGEVLDPQALSAIINSASKG